MNPEIWRVCAGISAARIPKPDSTVYYFPQGHADHSCLTYHLRHQSPILCRLSAVHLLADSKTDEVAAKLLLIPVAEHVLPQETNNKNNNSGDGQISWFSKILTLSDANNGCGFSIPRNCALSIFPELNLEEEKPTQFLDFTDVHGKKWRISHVYRGRPKRHLFTSGWRKFVDEKNLIAGDTIIFMKNSSGKLYVGIRRNRELVTTLQRKEESENSLAEAVDKAARNMEFEVLYYPKPGEWKFVVDAKIVEEAFKIDWMCGMRVKIDVETEDSSRIVSWGGTVTSIYGSHWRMLRVEWDESKALKDLKNAERVSPWEVKLVTSTFTIPFLPTKKLKAYQHRERGASWNQTRLSYGTSPIGIQGSRHNSFSSIVMNDPCVDMSASSSRNSSMQGLTTVPTISNIASSSSNISLQGLTTVPTGVTFASCQSGVFSPNHSDSSLNSFANNTKVGRGPIRPETIYPDALNSSGNTSEGGCSSMNLFGTTIYTDRSDSCDPGSSRGSDNQCKGKNKIA